MDRASGKRKQSSLNVKTAVKAQKTAEPSSSSDPQDNVAVEPDHTLFWIIISNVHKKAASEDIFRALFKGCTHVQSRAFQSDSANKFRGIVHVAFNRREDAEETVNHFHKNIKIFRTTWALCNRRQTYNRSSDAGSSSTESVTSYRRSPSESSDEGLAQTLGLRNLMQACAIGTGDSAKVTITNIDTRVPEEVIVPLMKKAGRLRSHEIFHDSQGKLSGTVEVVYEQSEEAIEAVKLFDDNITFFKKTWLLARDDDG